MNGLKKFFDYLIVFISTGNTYQRKSNEVQRCYFLKE